MKNEITLQQKLSQIQRELKAPKGQYNSFGKYHYRSCEDILNAIKPLLEDRFTITLSDEIVLIGDRYYVKATAIFSDGNSSIQNAGYARESLDKKGMDDSQITGSTSSYARKYALNGLFAIDDTKDADTMDNTKPVELQLDEVNIKKIQDVKNHEELVGLCKVLQDEKGEKYRKSIVHFYTVRKKELEEVA